MSTNFEHIFEQRGCCETGDCELCHRDAQFTTYNGLEVLTAAPENWQMPAPVSGRDDSNNIACHAHSI